ncbi:17520_t:CDS:2, partial [Gigaspora margarita]
LKKVIKSTFGFDVTRKRKAQRIIDNWKTLLILCLYFDENWIATMNNPDDRAQFKIRFQQEMTNAEVTIPPKKSSFTYLSSISYNEDKKLNEDTFVHRYCHQVFEEIFSKTEYSLIWANGESESSKARRLLDGHNRGRNPDFRIFSTIDDIDKEMVFGEIKPPHCTDTVNRSIIKLAKFMKGSLDFIIYSYGNVVGLETYGILIC